MKKMNLTAVIVTLLLTGLLASCGNKNNEKDIPEDSVEQSAPEAAEPVRQDTMLSDEEGPRGVSAEGTQASPPVLSKP